MLRAIVRGSVIGTGQSRRGGGRGGGGVKLVMQYTLDGTSSVSITGLRWVSKCRKFKCAGGGQCKDVYIFGQCQ